MYTLDLHLLNLGLCFDSDQGQRCGNRIVTMILASPRRLHTGFKAKPLSHKGIATVLYSFKPSFGMAFECGIGLSPIGTAGNLLPFVSYSRNIGRV